MEEIKNLNDWLAAAREKSEGKNGERIVLQFSDARGMVILYNDTYGTDQYRGVCTENAQRAKGLIRASKNSHILAVKPGKIIKSVSDYLGIDLDNNRLSLIAEELATVWKSHWVQTDDYELIIDTDFREAFYGGGQNDLDPDDPDDDPDPFISCMRRRDYWTFYRDALTDCRLARLVDKSGDMVCRAFILRAWDQYDNPYRLLERQYAKGEDQDFLKRLLVNKCIESGAIDGYKKIGAGCGDATKFLDKEGESLSDREFSISCKLEHGDAVAYQDSFKWYDYDDQTAYNYESPDEWTHYDECLNTTHGTYNGGAQVYDEYLDEYYPDQDLYSVWVDGNELSVIGDTRDEFFRQCYDGEYYHDDDVVEIDGDYYPKDDPNIVYSGLYNRYLLDADAYYSDVYDDYISYDDIVESDDGEYYYVGDADNVVLCDDCEYRYIGDCVIIDGVWFYADPEFIADLELV